MARNSFQWDDPFQLDQQLSEDERMIRDAAHAYCQEKLAPRVLEMFRHEKTDVSIFREMGELGLLGPTIPTQYGGAGLNYVSYGLVAREIERVDSGYRSMASVQSSLVMVPINEFGTEDQKNKYLPKLASGEFIGCFGLTEPDHGSDPGSMSSRAYKVDGGYRLKGNKMWISAGDHELTENIVHLVLAKIPGPDGKPVPGVKGISLFIVPKKLVDTEGQLTGERNDVALAGLNHKLGWRGTTNTLLNFGEGRFPVRGGAGAVGYLVGKPGEGLKCMFHMMNEARISIGMAATMLGLAGYHASLDYAQNRPQGRPIKGAPGAAGKDATRPQSRIIEHADVKRMLLAQKSYCEGALALNLFCARLVDEQHTGTPESVAEARLLLEVLTPISKSWPSEFCLEANSLAIQIHGGYGYTRDFPVEQYWRDNRLNMIHEGTHGIQAMDLLGRKVLMEGGKGLQLLATRVNDTIQRAMARPELAGHANELAKALQEVGATTKAAWATDDPQQALANAVPYMQAFGHTVLAWTWLDVSLAVLAKDAALAEPANAGRMAAMRYFFGYELPKIGAWLKVVRERDMTCAQMSEEAF